MPGLSQLKKFSEDIANLGNELKIRQKRGETPVLVTLPDVADIDDSDDFLLGMPNSEVEETESNEDVIGNESDITSDEIDLSDDLDSFDLDSNSEFPNLDSLLDSSIDEEIDFTSFPELEDIMAFDKTSEENITEENSVEDDVVPEDVPSEKNPIEDFPMPDFNFADLAESAFSEPEVDSFSEETTDEQDFSMPDIPDFDSFEAPQESFQEASQDSLDESTMEVAEDSANVFEMPDLPDFDSIGTGDDFFASQDSLEPIEPSKSVQDEFSNSSLPDLDEFVGLDKIDDLEEISSFSIDENDPVNESDLDFASFDVPGASLDDFDIPGFSSQVAGIAEIRSSKNQSENNTLTDSEYEQFKKNLASYPLNLRLAVEEFIVNNKYKDNVNFELIQKVQKKAPLRQVAAYIEKYEDVHIHIPRDFERRTYEQYEEYKKSAEYQLKNRILPVAILGVMAAGILACLYLFGLHAIYNPIKAELIYKEGYALLENNAYPQSEERFFKALEYQPKKRWFFRYAEGYRNHKQYERARMMYNAGLRRFNNDKQIGLDYADMELNDLRNFAEAERVVRREILDYHINDEDGMLLLGDIFLEWGDDKDSSKYEDARQIYAELLQLYGQQDIYLARMLRYFIRIDDLRNVLQLKSYFYPKKKSLVGQDIVELSGYLLNKLYGGTIAPNDEYLLGSIENVRELLERAVNLAPEIPESVYNMGLYFVYKRSNEEAKKWLASSLDSFANVTHKPRKRLLAEINAHRLLGELYKQDYEYIVAEEYFRTGISLFQEAQAAGLKGNKDVGLLYADLGDLNYFVSSDLDEALTNYLTSIEIENDTPSIRYKIGYIQYAKKRYAEALGSFIKTYEELPFDKNVLLALGNVLTMRSDNFAALGYYERLINILDAERSQLGIMFPQVNIEHNDIVDLYLKASNNLGVTQYRLARQTGNSVLNANAFTNLTASVRAWDALTRNHKTMIKLPGSNLAERNISYMSHPVSDYEPSIYTEIPRMIYGEIAQD